MTALTKCVETLAALARSSGSNRVVLMERAVDSFAEDSGADDETRYGALDELRIWDGIGSSRRSLWNIIGSTKRDGKTEQCVVLLYVAGTANELSLLSTTPTFERLVGIQETLGVEVGDAPLFEHLRPSAIKVMPLIWSSDQTADGHHFG